MDFDDTLKVDEHEGQPEEEPFVGEEQTPDTHTLTGVERPSVAGAHAVSDFDARWRQVEAETKLFGTSQTTIEVGRFRIMRKLGAGGMGIVYLGYDESLDRRVAIKLLRGASTPEAQLRLEREAQAMARLSHPNVVTVHEVGRHGGQLYVAMEFVEGQDLRSWLGTARRPWTEVVEVFRQAGEGLIAAHSAQVVHRDFKPDNVLVGVDKRVRVADFGLAHGLVHTKSRAQLDPSSRLDAQLTRTGTMLGTPAYMAPEQFAGSRTDARGDQFSFCVALWEGLYGQRPFQANNMTQLVNNVCAGCLRSPPEESEVPSWVHAVVVRGLAVEPDARWPDMASLLEALTKDPRRARRRAVYLMGAALGAGALLGAGWLALNELNHNLRQRYWNGLTEELLEIERERSFEVAQADALQARDATRMSVGRSLAPSISEPRSEQPAMVAALLREVEGEARQGASWLSMSNQVLGRPLSYRVLSGHRGALGPLLYSPDEAWLYSGADDGEVRRWSPSSGRGEIIIEHERLVSALALSPDGSLLASASEDGSVRLWSALTGEVRELASYEQPIMALSFDPSGARLAWAGHEGVLWVETLASRARMSFEVGARVHALSFDATGEQILAGSRDRLARVWQLDEPTAAPRLLRGHESPIYFARMLNRERALTAADDGSLRVWALDEEPPRGQILTRHAEAISAFALAPEGTRVATGATDGSMRVTSLEGPQESHALTPHGDEVWAVAFTPDGESVVSASFDETAHVSPVDGRATPRVFEGHHLSLYSLAVAPSGRWFATGSYDEDIRTWALDRPQLATPLRAHADNAFTVELDASGERAITASHDRSARVWSTADGSLLATLELDPGEGERSLLSARLNHAIFSPEGERVASATAGGEVVVWTLADASATRLETHSGAVWRLAFDHAGQRLAAATNGGEVYIWELAAFEQPGEPEPIVLRGHEDRVFGLAFDPAGARVITGSWDGSVGIWDPETGEQLGSHSEGGAPIHALVSSPAADLWATGADDGRVYLWPADFIGEPRVLAAHRGGVRSVAFDRTGERLISASDDGEARVWDVANARLLTTLRAHSGMVRDAALLDGGLMVTGGGDGVVRVWSPSFDEPLRLRAHQGEISDLVAIPGSARTITVSADGGVIMWDMSELSFDPEQLLTRLRGATRYCLSAEQRERQLGEAPERARQLARECD